MKSVPRPSLIDAVVAHVREQIQTGRWCGKLPGVGSLAAECGVSHPTMREALLRLEAAGIVSPGGNGRPRTISPQSRGADRRSLRVAVLLETPLEEQDAGFRQVLLHLQSSLEAQGYVCRFVPRCLRDLRHDLERIKRLVAGHPADAWVVLGATEETLRWFAAQPAPTIAIGGRCLGIPIASTGTEVLDAMRAAIRHLTGLGHQRIVFLFAHALRMPSPSRYVQAIGEELAACGVAVGRYNFPDWDETPQGFATLLESAFRITPPTAFVVQNSNWLAGLLSFLAERGLRVPRDVSVVSGCHDPTFPWITPPIAHLWSNEIEIAERVVEWVAKVARDGRSDLKCYPCPAIFVPAGSIGPPQGGKGKRRG